jgi:hypothetical protein
MNPRPAKRVFSNDTINIFFENCKKKLNEPDFHILKILVYCLCKDFGMSLPNGSDPKIFDFGITTTKCKIFHKFHFNKKDI